MTTPRSLLWIIEKVHNPQGLELWFNDGQQVTDVVRGGPNLSCRLMVESQGFLDITTGVVGSLPKNGQTLFLDLNDELLMFSDPTLEQPILLALSISGNGTFSAWVTLSNPQHQQLAPTKIIDRSFNPFPHISPEDVQYLDKMILEKYVPYQGSVVPGKTDEEIRALGAKLFPWTPYSYQLAMAVYDWTTASFARMVFMKVFQYTGLGPEPYPLDRASIALMIWLSNWDTYRSDDPDYMNAFLMEPAHSEAEVAQQLDDVAAELQQFSSVENSLLAAAVQSLPRTCILQTPYLFSGQVDVYQMGLSRFGIELSEFPGNAGPVGTALEVEFAAAAASFLQPGSVITTKVVWAFTDTEEDAKHYSNGILLVLHASVESLVWRKTAYITELSDGPTKTEYLCPPGSSFRVLSVHTGSDNVQVIELQFHTPSDAAASPVSDSFVGEQGLARTVTVPTFSTAVVEDSVAVDELPGLPRRRAIVIPELDQVPRGAAPTLDHVAEKCTNGRWCRCIQKYAGIGTL
ncbi:hypothetical protein C8Q74DRAFT_856157 [Fomes fomentarius]|nr:hypothetical protein C8Q74DRAFT_856157 [Fomes fomentarius]